MCGLGEMAKNELGVYLAFGSHHLQQNRHEKAIDIFLKCIEIDPSDYRGLVILYSRLRWTHIGYFNLGQAYASCHSEDRINDAITCFHKVFELNPKIIETYGTLSSCYIKIQAPELALEWCQKVSRSNSLE